MEWLTCLSMQEFFVLEGFGEDLLMFQEQVKAAKQMWQLFSVFRLLGCNLPVSLLKEQTLCSSVLTESLQSGCCWKIKCGTLSCPVKDVLEKLESKLAWLCWVLLLFRVHTACVLRDSCCPKGFLVGHRGVLMAGHCAFSLKCKLSNNY